MPSRTIFHDSVVPIPVDAGPLPNGLLVHPAGEVHAADRMHLHFSLGLSDEAEADLEARIARGERVPADELAKNYGASAKDEQALERWLRKQGFDIDHVTPDRSSIYASASAAQVAESLKVTMVRVTRDGFTYTAARNAPSLPDEVAGPVQAITGVQPFLQASKHGRLRAPRDGHRASPSPGTPDGPTTEVANNPPYLVGEILKAYGADNLGLNGNGETIAILIDTFPTDADLEEFWKRNGLDTTLQQVQKINVTGATLPPAEGEETLDVEWSSGIAPGATVRVYASGSLQFVDLDRALDAIIADAATTKGLHQLSISLGLGETFLSGPGGEVAVEHQKFLKLAALGVNVFVSSGDAGSNPDGSGHSSSGPLQVEYEASDPNVIGVGGTTLKLKADGTVADETGWASSGGGRSIYFPRPPWQWTPEISGKRRLVPDVSLTADPEEGGLVVLNGQTVQFGGTSWSAPVWAAFCALLNEARANAGKPPLSFLGPILYPLAGTTCFRDITQGANGAYHAATGYDLVTGLGVPDLEELVAALT